MKTHIGENIKKNDVIPLRIDALSIEGQGVAKHNGLVVFVPFTAPGDEIEARVEKVNKNHAYARAVKITKPSKHRIDADCPVFGKCGGCAFRHMSYEAELDAKLSVVSDALKRVGGVDLQPDGIIPSPLLTGYRNKAVLPFGGDAGNVKLGFYAERSHRLVPVESCGLYPDVFSEIQKTVLDFINSRKLSAYNETDGSGLLRHLYLRRGERSGEIMACLVVNGEGINGEDELTNILIQKFPAVKSVMVNKHTAKGNANLGVKWRVLYGREYINDSICGLNLRVSAGAFYQVNTSAAEKLYEAAFEMAETECNENILDLFCGIGAIGLFFAKKLPHSSVTGVEVEQRAVSDARENARLNNIGNIRFIQANLGQPERSLKSITEGFSTVIADPPRKGLDKLTIEAIAAAKPKKIVYISCDPATLSRDIKYFGQYGYKAVKTRAADLFPRTKHVESVVIIIL
jgi:23S rRNA (uracil1939-C5)-methyltransferase